MSLVTQSTPFFEIALTPATQEIKVTIDTTFGTVAGCTPLSTTGIWMVFAFSILSNKANTDFHVFCDKAFIGAATFN